MGWRKGTLVLVALLCCGRGAWAQHAFLDSDLEGGLDRPAFLDERGDEEMPEGFGTPEEGIVLGPQDPRLVSCLVSFTGDAEDDSAEDDGTEDLLEELDGPVGLCQLTGFDPEKSYPFAFSCWGAGDNGPLAMVCSDASARNCRPASALLEMT